MSFINELDSIIAERKENPSDSSYTTTLFEGGIDRILRKVGEEAGEFIIATKNEDKVEMANEAADLLYHVLVTLRASGMSVSDVEAVLRERHK